MNPEYRQLINHLKDGGKIVTASHRQARFIRKLWQQSQQQAQAQLESWQQAECFAWDEWLQQLFDYSTLSLALQQKLVPRILTNFEQKWLWQQFLEKQLNTDKVESLVPPLQQQQSLISSLMQAWKYSVGWCVDVNSEEFSDSFEATEETRIFKKISNEFNLECKNNNWLSIEKLTNYLSENEESWSTIIEDNIYFYGFDDWTLQQKQFLQIAKQSKALVKIEEDSLLVQTVEKQPNATSDSLKVCASKYTEWQQAATWARQLAESEVEAEIVIVIPDLSTEREQVLRIFQEVFQPQLQIRPDAVVATGFNLSAGELMNQQAIVKSAKLWLSLLNGGAGELWKNAMVDEFCRGSESERWPRASLKHRSRLNNRKFYSPEIYQKNLLKEDIIPVKQWLELVNLVVESKQEIRVPKSISEWCYWTELYLKKIGWPSSNTLTSKTYQAKNQWLDNLRKLSAMENLCKKINYSDYLILLEDQLNSLNFQAETPSARVQVLGVFEAIGLGFDYLWLSGCQANNFPSPINVNPWLPIHLQQKLNMPGASSQREQQFVAKLFKGFKQHCEHLIFSYAVADGDAEQLPSAFIEHLTNNHQGSRDIIPEKLPEYWSQQTIAAKSSIKTWIDSQGKKLTSGEVKSGVGILANQASCPFKAYASFRLDANTNDRESIGIDALQRGNWVHATLEMIWLRLGSQKALLELDHDPLKSLVEECVKEIILKPSKLPSADHTPLIKLEYQRTIELVLAWLELDRARPPFLQVEVEQASEVSVGPLNFTVRADRIDNLADGSKIVLDYKTGKVNCNSWFSERITEPQLPLYGLLFSDKLSAAAFAQLNAEGCLIKGFGEDDLEINGIQDVSKKDIKNWKTLIEQWQTNLENIATEYAQGLATIERQANACDYCEFPHLCRRDAYLDTEYILQTHRPFKGESI